VGSRREGSTRSLPTGASSFDSLWRIQICLLLCADSVPRECRFEQSKIRAKTLSTRPTEKISPRSINPPEATELVQPSAVSWHAPDEMVASNPHQLDSRKRSLRPRWVATLLRLPGMSGSRWRDHERWALLRRSGVGENWPSNIALDQTTQQFKGE
jgi:hypothetical protein